MQREGKPYNCESCSVPRYRLLSHFSLQVHLQQWTWWNSGHYTYPGPPLENSWLIWCLQQGGRDHTNIIPMIAHLTLTYSFKYIFKFPYLVPWGSSNFHFPFAHCSASSQLLRALVGIFLLRAFDVVMMVQMPTAGTGFRRGVGWFIISPWKNNLQRNSYTLNRARKIQYLLPTDMITRRFLISEQSNSGIGINSAISVI